MKTIEEEVKNLQISTIKEVLGPEILKDAEETLKEARELQKEYDLLSQASKTNKQFKRKAADISNKLVEEIDTHQKMTAIYENTSSSKEAYEQIVKWPKLKHMISYSQYASLYVLDEIETYLIEKDFKYLTIEPMMQYRNNLPHVYVAVRHPLFWASFYILPEGDFVVDLSKIFNSNMELNLERKIRSHLDSIETYTSNIDIYNEKLKQIEKFIYSLVVSKGKRERYKKKINKRMNADKHRMAQSFMKLQKDIEELSEYDSLNIEESINIISNELEQVVSFLTTHLKYDITIKPLSD